MCNNELMRSSYIIFKMLDDIDAPLEQEILKNKIKRARSDLLQRGIIIDFDFIDCGGKLESQRFNEVIEFGISTDIINERPGSVMLEITPSGREFITDMPLDYTHCLDANFIQVANAVIQEIIRE